MASVWALSGFHSSSGKWICALRAKSGLYALPEPPPIISTGLYHSSMAQSPFDHSLWPQMYDPGHPHWPWIPQYNPAERHHSLDRDPTYLVLQKHDWSPLPLELANASATLGFLDIFISHCFNAAFHNILVDAKPFLGSAQMGGSLPFQTIIDCRNGISRLKTHAATWVNTCALVWEIQCALRELRGFIAYRHSMDMLQRHSSYTTTEVHDTIGALVLDKDHQLYLDCLGIHSWVLVDNDPKTAQTVATLWSEIFTCFSGMYSVILLIFLCK